VLVQHLLAEQRYSEAEAAAGNLIELIVNEEKSTHGAAPQTRAGSAGNYYAVAYNQLGMALLGRSREADALHCFEEALRADPDNTGVHHNKALALMELGESAEAEQVLRRLLRIDGSAGKSVGLLGVLLSGEGRLREARDCYEKALRLSPGLVSARCRLAWLLATCSDATVRDGDRALKLALELCRSVDFQSVSALETLAAAYAENGDFRKAVESAERALRIAEGNAADRLEGHIESYRRGEPLRE
jgi:tetratricopeptide (TPR) repeat protein